MLIEKCALVIPLHNQSNNWELILAGIKKNDRIPDIVYAVLDRCSVDEAIGIKEISNKSELRIEHIELTIPISNTIVRENDELFLAGHARNIGMERALNDGADCVIFIDGDCIPQPKLISSHISALSIDDPLMTIGRRREKKYNWLDQRECIPQYQHLELFRQSGVVINSGELLLQSLIVWSCNIGLNKKAIQRISKFNELYYNRKELFNSAFNGAWGGEDGFLGITAWHSRVIMSTIGERSSGVQHIDHPRPSEKYTMEHKAFYDSEIEKLKKKTRITPITVDFFR